MKRIVAVVLAAAIATAAAGCGTTQITATKLYATAIPTLSTDIPDWTATWEQQSTAGRQARPRVVFFGDSITAHWLTYGKSAWARDFAPMPAFDLGIPGDQTQNMLFRIDHGQLDGLTPQVTVVLAGTNDLGHSDPAVEQGVEQVVTAIQQHLPRTRIILEGIYPISKPGTALYDQVPRVNGVLTTWAALHHVEFIDPGHLLLNAQGQFLSGVIAVDLKHPLGPGYVILAKSILPRVRDDLSISG